MEQDPFWAGGYPLGWFVKFRAHEDLHEIDHPMIRWFPSRDYPGGETKAAELANALAEALNQAFHAAR